MVLCIQQALVEVHQTANTNDKSYNVKDEARAGENSQNISTSQVGIVIVGVWLEICDKLVN